MELVVGTSTNTPTLQKYLTMSLLSSKNPNVMSLATYPNACANLLQGFDVVRRGTHFLLRQMVMSVTKESRENERLEIQKRGKYNIHIYPKLN